MAKKSEAERLAELKTRQEKLKAQIARLEAKSKQEERKQDTRRKIIIGAAVMEHARQHPDFAAELKDVLRAAVTRDMDREAVKDWL